LKKAINGKLSKRWDFRKMSIRRRVEQLEKKRGRRRKVPRDERIYLIFTGDGKTEEKIQEEIEANRQRLMKKHGSSDGVIYVPESPFPAPASSNAACGFPALRFLC